MKTPTLLFALATTLCFNAYSQTPLTANNLQQLNSTPSQILQQELVGSHVTVGNVQINSPKAAQSIGTFQANDASSAIGFASGMLLATGSIGSAPLTHTNNNNFGANSEQGSRCSDFDIFTMLGMTKLQTDRIFDAASIEFDVVPEGNELSLNYAFASEEYPEFVGAELNDAFAILISGPGIDGDINGYKNIALLPNSHIEVGINTINNAKTLSNANPSSDWFINNAKGSVPVQFDGLTKSLTAKQSVRPNATYHIKIVVADLNDTYFDSALLIEKQSLSSTFAPAHSYRVAKPNTQTAYTANTAQLVP